MRIHQALLDALAGFYAEVDSRTRLLEQAMPEVLCVEGCHACCFGNIFVVTALDFAYVCRYARRHLSSETLAHVVATAESQAAECGTELAYQLEAVAGPVEHFVGQPCPLLMEGRCLVYQARPTPCRLFGRTRFASGRLNLCDKIYYRLPAGGNGDAQGRRTSVLPVVEAYSRLLASYIRRGSDAKLLRQAERLVQVSTLPVLIARTKLDERLVLDAIE
jgi:Fe-S-cluster containining protein